MDYTSMINKKLKNILTDEDLLTISESFSGNPWVYSEHLEKAVSLIHNEKIREENEKYSKEIKTLQVSTMRIYIIQCICMFIQCLLIMIQIISY